MFENYLPQYIRLGASLLMALFTTWGVQAQTYNRLIYTQQSTNSASDQLRVADLTGSLPTAGTTLASNSANFGQPNDLIFDPTNNYIYLIDGTANLGPILRYTYNPATNAVSNRTVIVNPTTTGSTSTSVTYQSLALDAKNNRLYFAQSSFDNAFDAIKVVSLSGATPYTPTLLINGGDGSFSNPNDLAFDPINNYLYVADSFLNSGAILRFNTTGSAVSNRTSIVAGLGSGNAAYGGLALDLVNNKLYFTQYTNSLPTTGNPLDALKVVDLSTTSYPVTTLKDGTNAPFTLPQDITLDRANNYLYVADQATSGSIYRYALDGSGQTTVTGPASASSSYSGVALTIGVFTPVLLTSSTPADNATGVSITTNIVLTFDRAVTKGTGNFEIRRTSDNVVVENIPVSSAQVTGSGTTWTIDPSITLTAGTTYALRASSGIFTAPDGGSYAGISDNTTLNFTTNAAPTDISLNNSSVAENQPVGTIVGILSTTDADAGQTFSYALVSGTGADDNASFQIVGNQLRTNAVFNFEARNSYTIRVQTTDNGTPGLSFQKALTITVTNINELAVSITAKTDVSCNGGANGTATVTATGENPPFSYLWRNTTTNTTLAQTSSAVTGLTAGTYSVTVTATASSFSATTSFTINQPAALALTTSFTNVSSAGGNQGAASVSVSGGTPAYSYDWSPGNPTGDGTSSISSLTAGIYTVTVTDSKGCTAASSVTVTTAPDLGVLIYARPTVVYGPSSFSIVVDVVETNNVSTSGSITVRITKKAQLDLSFDNSLTSLGGRPVQNGAWVFSSANANYYELTTNQPMLPGSRLSLGLSGVLTPGATSGMLSCSVNVLGGGEIRMTNNSNANQIQYFQQ